MRPRPVRRTGLTEDPQRHLESRAGDGHDSLPAVGGANPINSASRGKPQPRGEIAPQGLQMS